MMHEDEGHLRTGLRFYFFDAEGNACKLSHREWMALHDDLQYRRLPPDQRSDKLPPHKRNPRLAGRIVVVVEALLATSNRRVKKATHLRGFRHLFDEDGRLNLRYADRHLKASLAMREKLFEGEDLSPAKNPLTEFRHELSTEEAALVRADLYRSKHSKK